MLGGRIKHMTIFTAPLVWFSEHFFTTVLTLIYLVWYMVEVMNLFTISRSGDARQGRERRSFFVVGSTVLLSFLVAYAFRGVRVGVVPDSMRHVGLMIMVIGIVLREWSLIMHGQLLQPAAPTQSGHAGFARGPYRWIRYPSYTGGLLAIVGYTLGFGTLIGAIVVAFIGVFVYAYRIQIEEQLLLTNFGATYREYQQQTWKLFPGW